MSKLLQSRRRKDSEDEYSDSDHETRTFTTTSHLGEDGESSDEATDSEAYTDSDEEEEETDQEVEQDDDEGSIIVVAAENNTVQAQPESKSFGIYK
jgi:hypothetical protein